MGVSAVLPNYYVIISSTGSSWSASFTLQNDDGTPMDISTKTFEFVARPSVDDRSTVPKISVTSTASTSQGTILVNISTSTVQVVVSATATANWSGGTYTLWMNPNLNDAEAMAQGPFTLQPTTAP